ncbi:hypothetical protein Plhal304r1_c006g0025991 [Plasmopara halstedii]
MIATGVLAELPRHILTINSRSTELFIAIQCTRARSKIQRCDSHRQLPHSPHPLKVCVYYFILEYNVV